MIAFRALELKKQFADAILMNALPPEVREYAERSVLAWLATVDADGCPNVSPKEIFAVVDGRDFVIAHIASPASVRNLLGQPKACLSFVDVFVQKGFKVKGTAEVVAPGAAGYERWAQPLAAMTQGRFPIHAVIVLHPESVEPIVAPSYLLHPDSTTELSQYRNAVEAYLAVPKPDGAAA